MSKDIDQGPFPDFYEMKKRQQADFLRFLSVNERFSLYRWDINQCCTVEPGLEGLLAKSGNQLIPFIKKELDEDDTLHQHKIASLISLLLKIDFYDPVSCNHQVVHSARKAVDRLKEFEPNLTEASEEYVKLRRNCKPGAVTATLN